jgi:hypothetical protein
MVGSPNNGLTTTNQPRPLSNHPVFGYLGIGLT